MQERGLTVQSDAGRGTVVQVRQAENDNQVVGPWLHGRPITTSRAYAYEVQALLSVVGKPLNQVTLGDLQGFFSGLEDLAPTSQGRAINAVKSLFSFAQKIGYLNFNPAAAVHAPKIKNTLAERILTETQVHRLISLELSPRNRALLLLTYALGGRVSEVCGLKWRDMQERTIDGQTMGQVTVYGKGGKTRVVLLSPETWRELTSLLGDADLDKLVFPSRKGQGHLHPVQVDRIIKVAAKRAGIDAPVSPHWLRHAHASHALDRGAPIHLVQATLGHASVATTGKYLHARPEDSSARYLGV